MNAIDKWVTTATIHDEPRRSLWSVVFPDARVPIKSILPCKASAGHPGGDFYLLDVDALTAEQREGLILVLAARYCQRVEAVRAELCLGVPIQAEGVSVASADQGLFFSLLDGEKTVYWENYEEVLNDDPIEGDHQLWEED